MSNNLLRKPEVLRRSGESYSTFHVHLARGLWTRPIALGARAVAWPEREIEALLAARIAGATSDQLRQLVERLHAERRRAATMLERNLSRTHLADVASNAVMEAG